MTTLKARVEEAIAQGFSPADLARAATVDGAAASSWRRKFLDSMPDD